MYADDIQWALNQSRMEYEIFMYNLTGNSGRVVTIEMAPMALHNLCIRMIQTIERDFPPVKPNVQAAAVKEEVKDEKP